MPELVIPNTLSDGTVITAAAHNENYAAIAGIINGNLGSDNVGGGLPPLDKSVTWKKLAPGIQSLYGVTDGEWTLSSAENTYAKSGVIVVPAFTPDIDCTIIINARIGTFTTDTSTSDKDTHQYRIGIAEDIQNQLATTPALDFVTLFNHGLSGGDALKLFPLLVAYNCSAGKQYRFVVTGTFKSTAPSSSANRHVQVTQARSLYWLVPR